MTSWPIGLSTGCFYHRNILDCLPLIRESGFSMIEVCSTPEHLNFHDLKLVASRRGANQRPWHGSLLIPRTIRAAHRHCFIR